MRKESESIEKLVQKYWTKLVIAIEKIEEGMFVSEACKAAGITSGTFYRALHGSEEIRERYVTAHEQFTSRLERALLNIRNDSVYGSKNPREQRIMSDNLKHMLARLDRSKYSRENRSDGIGASNEVAKTLQRAKARLTRAENSKNSNVVPIATACSASGDSSFHASLSGPSSDPA